VDEVSVLGDRGEVDEGGGRGRRTREVEEGGGEAQERVGRSAVGLKGLDEVDVVAKKARAMKAWRG